MQYPISATFRGHGERLAQIGKEIEDHRLAAHEAEGMKQGKATPGR